MNKFVKIKFDQKEFYNFFLTELKKSARYVRIRDEAEKREYILEQMLDQENVNNAYDKFFRAKISEETNKELLLKNTRELQSNLNTKNSPKTKTFPKCPNNYKNIHSKKQERPIKNTRKPYNKKSDWDKWVEANKKHAGHLLLRLSSEKSDDFLRHIQTSFDKTKK